MKASSLGIQGLVVASVTGLVTGCAESAKPSAGSASAKAAPAGNEQHAKDKNCCVGKNECKGKGGCAGEGHDCAGKNECKGKGGCSMRDCTASAASSAKP